ncbi:aryl-sulfate sulfotransferase [Shewanella youngdeokensis]|uniref:Aryl-sulfate sulfotransferase n=1 Tax=Shewanella youngdeokensis TaxID=2999068 RepID=A0ABZ0JZ13_9GAMM|nr:aryl-sulfate sulfotransferase [Shewanella sp. DAU334]
MKKLIISAISLAVLTSPVYAAGGDKPHRKGAKTQGQIGSILVNPYKNAPLTAIIDLAGNKITDVSVVVQGKGKNGIDIKYDVEQSSINTHNGIPVAGLYPNFNNTVDVTYTKDGKKIAETYRIMTSGMLTVTTDGFVRNWPEITPKKVAKGFEERMYYYTADIKTAFSGEVSWAKGGALTWDFDPGFKWIADTQGEMRWYLNPAHFDGREFVKYRGTLQMYQVDSGDWIWMKGQSYGMMDFMGRMLWERPMPRGFADGSHEILLAENDHIFLRVGKRNYKRDDGQIVNTVRDHIIEVDALSGDVTKVWDMGAILDPNREEAILSQNPAAVCMEIDLSKEGEKQEIEPDAPFGDHAGIGIGRNWAHINSIDYDPSDDSIIISSRQQSAVAKITRDDQVKWILSSPEGWEGKLREKVLIPVNAKGKPIECKYNRCEDNFDYTWAQHAAFLTGKGTLTVFDNGDGRGMEQAALKSMNYSRAVEYKINEEKGTVEQVWEFGKELGYDYFSTVVSLVEYQKDKNTNLIHFGARHLFEQKDVSHPTLMEVSANDSKEIKVEMEMQHVAPGLISYRARVIDFDTAL